MSILIDLLAFVGAALVVFALWAIDWRAGMIGLGVEFVAAAFVLAALRGRAGDVA